MGSLKGLSWFVEGFLARMLYVSLHLLHRRAVSGWMRTGGLAVARTLIRRHTALVKLHWGAPPGHGDHFRRRAV